jgi:cysteine desulfurase
MIYLDHNATTPVDAEVIAAMSAALEVFGNPSSGHRLGIAAKTLIEESRAQVASLLGCDASEIVFTSGGTESNNLAILGTAWKVKAGHLITTVIEHPSVMNPVLWLRERGFDVTLLPVDSSGMVSPEDVGRAVRKDTVLITVMHANNETGVLQPLPEIAEIARERGIPFHTDAAQSVGKMRVSVDELAVDMLTVVSHKFYGPKGVGALYIRGFSGSSAGHAPQPILLGAGHERGMRPGTENTPAIVGLGRACAVAWRDCDARVAHALHLRDGLHRLLEHDLEIALNGHETFRLPNTLNVSIRGILAEDLVALLRDDVAFSAGSACHAGLRKPSQVLKAMGLTDERALSSVSLTVGKDNARDEIETAADLIVRAVRKLRAAGEAVPA